MVMKCLGLGGLFLAGLFVPLLLASGAEAGVLHTGRVRVGEGDHIECAGFNASTVTVPIKLELLDGDGGGVVTSVDCPAIPPGTNGGNSGCDSELFHTVSFGAFDALCRITVTGFPASHVRANMVVRLGAGAGAISTDGLPAPVPFSRPITPGLLEQLLESLFR